MQKIHTVLSMERQAWKWRRAGVRVALVPTMGYLHQGHLSLVQKARSRVGPEGRVVVSIYVNPTQFAPGEDLSKYPRDLKRDMALCRAAGVDAVFAPRDGQMYEGGESLETGGQAFSTHVVEHCLSQSMEGKSRPTHFRGVTTVVAKLFHLVQPEVSVFGAKDFQQAAVIRRMVRDLNFPLQVLVAPTFREKDGLAMSSRNKFLSDSERAQAVVLFQALQWASACVRQSPRRASFLENGVQKMVARNPLARLDYVAFFDPLTLVPKPTVAKGHQMALAVFFGRTRLIDNRRL